MTTYTKIHHSKAILAVLALLVVPGLASAASSLPMARSNEVGTFALGGTLGLSLGLGDDSGGTGIKATANGYYTITEFSPQMPFDIGGHLGFTYAGCGGGGTADCSMTIIEITPAARLRYKFTPQVAFYADFGLGLDFASVSVEGYDSDTETALMLRLASGITYQLTSQLALVGEPLGLSFYFHDPSVTRYNISAGILYRF
jgi:hypothetical protein